MKLKEENKYEKKAAARQMFEIFMGIERTGSTFQIITVVSLDPVASLVPSGEKRQNQTSSQ
jgi:hypothetical protein